MSRRYLFVFNSAFAPEQGWQMIQGEISTRATTIYFRSLSTSSDKYSKF